MIYVKVVHRLTGKTHSRDCIVLKKSEPKNRWTAITEYDMTDKLHQLTCIDHTTNLAQLVTNGCIDIAPVCVGSPQMFVCWKTSTENNSTHCLICTDQIVYEGNVNEQMQFHGHGTKRTPRFTHTGEWRFGEMRGVGVCKFESGEVQVGEFCNGELNGHASITYPNGDTYVGNYVNHVKQGFGTYTFSDKEIHIKYSGQWMKSKYHGEGSMYYADGSVHTGAFIDNKMTGFGTRTFSDGRIFSGMFDNETPCGECKMILSDGTLLEGTFVTYKLHGTGKMTLPNGDVSNGNWAYGVQVEHFDIRFANGDMYSGETKDGKMHGNGKLIQHSDGTLYDGAFVNGEKHGHGTETSQHGAVFVGRWVRGRRNGCGTKTAPNGTIVRSEWSDGVCMAVNFGAVKQQPLPVKVCNGDELCDADISNAVTPSTNTNTTITTAVKSKKLNGRARKAFKAKQMELGIQ